MQLIYNPWLWYVTGHMIVLLIALGKSFGMSSDLRITYVMAGNRKYSDFFILLKDNNGK